MDTPFPAHLAAFPFLTHRSRKRFSAFLVGIRSVCEGLVYLKSTRSLFEEYPHVWRVPQQVQKVPAHPSSRSRKVLTFCFRECILQFFPILATRNSLGTVHNVFRVTCSECGGQPPNTLRTQARCVVPPKHVVDTSKNTAYLVRTCSMSGECPQRVC